jgi:F-type H+-transporting ATPase subunit alpha
VRKVGKEWFKHTSLGVVSSANSSVCSLQGFVTAMVGEVFTFLSVRLSLGMVVNIQRERYIGIRIGALILQLMDKLVAGSVVSANGLLLSVIVGGFVLGSIFSSLGDILVCPALVVLSSKWILESGSPAIVDRQSVFEALEVGIIAIDSMIPIGRGQRELIVGDRQSGKTSIGLDGVINQRFSGVLCVYVAIALKSSTVLEVYLLFLERSALFYSAIVVEASDSLAVLQYLVAYTGASVSEYFMYVQEFALFLIYDDFSKHACAFREVSLLLRRPPGREAYPGEIFFVHSRLLERSAKLSDARGGGSITAFPVIETLSGDVSAYIPTNVISITDGQIFLSVELFNSGRKPAIDVGLSVSRVGSSAQADAMKLVSSSYKLELAQFAELQAFSQFAADLGPETKARLERGLRFLAILNQLNGFPISRSQETALLSMANQGVILGVDLSAIAGFVHTYLLFPTWVSHRIPARLMGFGIVKYLKLLDL